MSIWNHCRSPPERFAPRLPPWLMRTTTAGDSPDRGNYQMSSHSPWRVNVESAPSKRPPKFIIKLYLASLKKWNRSSVPYASEKFVRKLQVLDHHVDQHVVHRLDPATPAPWVYHRKDSRNVQNMKHPVQGLCHLQVLRVEQFLPSQYIFSTIQIISFFTGENAWGLLSSIIIKTNVHLASVPFFFNIQTTKIVGCMPYLLGSIVFQNNSTFHNDTEVTRSASARLCFASCWEWKSTRRPWHVNMDLHFTAPSPPSRPQQAPCAAWLSQQRLGSCRCAARGLRCVRLSTKLPKRAFLVCEPQHTEDLSPKSRQFTITWNAHEPSCPNPIVTMTWWYLTHQKETASVIWPAIFISKMSNRTCVTLKRHFVFTFYLQHQRIHRKSYVSMFFHTKDLTTTWTEKTNQSAHCCTDQHTLLRTNFNNPFTSCAAPK